MSMPLTPPLILAVCYVRPAGEEPMAPRLLQVLEGGSIQLLPGSLGHHLWYSLHGRLQVALHTNELKEGGSQVHGKAFTPGKELDMYRNQDLVEHTAITVT